MPGRRILCYLSLDDSPKRAVCLRLCLSDDVFSTIREVGAAAAGPVAAADDLATINETTALGALNLHVIRSTGDDVDRHACPSRRRAGLGGWRIESRCRASSRRPWPTRLTDAGGSVVAVVRDEAAVPSAPETTHARRSNCPVHGEASLDVRRSELTSCLLRARRKHDSASAECVARVQGAAGCHRPYAN